MTLAKNLWKVTIDPRGKSDLAANSFDYCRSQSIVGIGWNLYGDPRSVADAYRLFDQHHKGYRKTAFNVLVKRMSVGDYVWVYGDRKYFLCRIDSDWIHAWGGDWDRHDIHNYRKTTWMEIPARYVPGVAKRSLTMVGTAKRIGCLESTLRYCDWLYENASTTDLTSVQIDPSALRPALIGATPKELFEPLDADETEDVVGFYIQANGWYVVKSSGYRNRRRFECEFTRSSGGVTQVAYMQVKSGSVPLRVGDYQDVSDAGDFLYLFSTADNPYPGLNQGCPAKVIPITHQEMKGFLVENANLLPHPMALKYAILFGAASA